MILLVVVIVVAVVVVRLDERLHLVVKSILMRDNDMIVLTQQGLDTRPCNGSLIGHAEDNCHLAFVVVGCGVIRGCVRVYCGCVVGKRS